MPASCRSFTVIPIALAILAAGCDGSRHQERVGTSDPNAARSPDGASSSATTQQPPAPVSPVRCVVPSAAELEELRARLEWAVAIAERFPCPPFERDKARLRQACVDAALSRGWLDQARTIARGIDGWRRGESSVQVSRALDASGRSAEADDLINDALALDQSTWPDWARARVRAACASYRLRRGDDRLAMEVLRGPDAGLSGEVQVARTALMPAKDLPEQERMFERAIATMNFDLAKTGIDGQFTLLRRWKEQPADFDRVLMATTAALKGLPIDLQVKYECDLATLLESVGRRQPALDALKRGADLAASTQFLPEDVIPVGVTVARACAELGLGDDAASRAQALERTYVDTESTIVDMKRSTSLRALAELRAALGDPAAARALYVRAIDAAQLNPNSRPRADDLCMVVCSMATSGIAPDGRITSLLEAAGARLGDPW